MSNNYEPYTGTQLETYVFVNGSGIPMGSATPITTRTVVIDGKRYPVAVLLDTNGNSLW